ncbi:conjugal transfer protein TraA [Galbibacter marinus]|uniref:Conjugal transfer protein TraA n=1 Tax=Galbibacter marinus TaxID=555500 RepID=K2PZ30_9FLAO|nr:ParA family protein [Galbibacter marinus]EKF53856.1 conjugal transfer protein TraA [Galbibacter marinus]
MAKIILITHQKGGVGKSTLVFNLAQNISENARVAILDMDLQGSLSQLVGYVENIDILPYQERFKDISEQNYDFIFIDTPPYLSNHLSELINIADLIIIPTKAGILDLFAIKSTIDLIEEEDKLNKTMVVFNMVKANTTLTLDILIEIAEYQVKIADTHISDLVAFTRSILIGGVNADKNAQKQLDTLTREILNQLI